MVKEEVMYMDGTSVSVDVNRIGFRTANRIAKKHIPIDSLTFNKDNTFTINGNIDLLGLSESCLETIKGLDLDKLDSAEANRLFSKYFQKDVMAGIGQGGSPN